MKAATIVMLAVAGTGAAAVPFIAAKAQREPPASISMYRAGDTWRAVGLVCDATNRDRVLVMSAPDRTRRVTLTSLTKPGMAPQSMLARLGRGDAGMSQLWYPLSDLSGREIGNVHSVSPGMVEPGATTPTVTSITIGRERTNCRFAPQTRVLGATAKRSIQIVQTPTRGYRYRSYNYDATLAEVPQPWGGVDTRASLTIDNGRVVDQSGGRRVYQFANGGYVYRVLASVDPAKGGGGVQVWRDGRMVLAEPFAAYTAAVRP